MRFGQALPNGCLVQCATCVCELRAQTMYADMCLTDSFVDAPCQNKCAYSPTLQLYIIFLYGRYPYKYLSDCSNLRYAFLDIVMCVCEFRRIKQHRGVGCAISSFILFWSCRAGVSTLSMSWHNAWPFTPRTQFFKRKCS